MNKRPNVILIVDDTPENLRVLGELLEADGHEVLVATNGKDGLSIAQSSTVDLILLDVMMPGMDGFEVCKKLKKNRLTRDIPVIFLTALDSTDDEAEGLRLGAVDYIPKPFKLEIVRARIRNQLALHNALEELKRHKHKLEELVEERSEALVEAHRRLLTIDSAKYDFLQLIYQKLWASEKGIITLARRAFESLSDGQTEAKELKTTYETSQSELFETINNALLMGGTHSGDRPAPSYPIKLGVVVADCLRKLGPSLTERGLSLNEDPATGEMSERLVSGDLDLTFQALTTVFHAAVLIAKNGSVLKVSSVEVDSLAVLEVLAERPDWAREEILSLFEPSVQFHPSSVGKQLGLAVPLASKIMVSQGGRITMEERGPQVVEIRVSFSKFAPKRGVRIAL
jgi:DNA-binding response OmpR family regulator